MRRKTGVLRAALFLLLIAAVHAQEGEFKVGRTYVRGAEDFARQRDWFLDQFTVPMREGQVFGFAIEAEGPLEYDWILTTADAEYEGHPPDSSRRLVAAVHAPESGELLFIVWGDAPYRYALESFDLSVR